MSKHRAARSKASESLTTQEIRDYESLLKKQGAGLLRHPEVVRGLLRAPSKVGQALRSLVPNKDPHAQARTQWEAFYLKFFVLTADFSRVAIPKQPDGFGRLVIVAQGVTLNTAMEACKKHFPTWQHCDDLDKDVVKNDRTAQSGAYAVWFRDRIEADEEMANKSANDLATEGIAGVTLLERILMELEYFGRTSQHLDIRNVTLCTGSRYSDGSVPKALWSVGRFFVPRYDPYDHSPSLRSRVAVS